MNRRELLKSGALTVTTGMLGLWPTIRAYAGTPLDTLVVVTEYGPNSLDIQGLGANQPTHGPSWNVYDRLLSYGTKTLEDGTASYDYKSLTPELAESWEVAEDGMSATFKLRPNAVFHDGSPVTAADSNGRSTVQSRSAASRRFKWVPDRWRSPNNSKWWTIARSAFTSFARTS